MIVSIYHMLVHREPYRDLGYDYFDKRKKDTKVNRLTRQLEKLGYAVSLEPLVSTAQPAAA